MRPWFRLLWGRVRLCSVMCDRGGSFGVSPRWLDALRLSAFVLWHVCCTSLPLKLVVHEVLVNGEEDRERSCGVERCKC
jgi:hypothetical protein